MPEQAQPKVVVLQLVPVYKKSKALIHFFQLYLWSEKPVNLLDQTSF